MSKYNNDGLNGLGILSSSSASVRNSSLIKQAKTAQQALKQHNLYIQSLHKLLEQKSNAAVLFDITKEFE